MNVYRGEIYMAEFKNFDRIGSEQKGLRPVVIIQNDIGNKHSTTTIVAMITARQKPTIPTHMNIKLKKPSIIMCEQIVTIDKERLKYKIGKLSKEQLEELEKRLKISLGVV